MGSFEFMILLMAAFFELSVSGLMVVTSLFRFILLADLSGVFLVNILPIGDELSIVVDVVVVVVGLAIVLVSFLSLISRPKVCRKNG